MRPVPTMAETATRLAEINQRISAIMGQERPWLGDRDCLPLLWDELERRHLMGSYMSHLCALLPKGKFNVEDYIAVHTAPLSKCGEAFLRAIDG